MAFITLTQRPFRALVVRKNGPSMPWADATPVPTVLSRAIDIAHTLEVGKASELADVDSETGCVVRARHTIGLVS